MKERVRVWCYDHAVLIMTVALAVFFVGGMSPVWFGYE